MNILSSEREIEIEVADYSKIPRESGIDIRSIDYEGSQYLVLKRLVYVSLNFGFINTGVGRVGLYMLENVETGEEFVACLKDYCSAGGPWRIILVPAPDDSGEEYRLADASVEDLMEAVSLLGL